MGKPLEVLIIFFDDFYDVGLGCASTIALALILPGLSNKVRSPRVGSCWVHLYAKSLYKSRAGRHFYGTENVIWAGFGQIGNTEKKSDWLSAAFEGGFSSFQGQNIFFFETTLASPLKRCIKCL